LFVGLLFQALRRPPAPAALTLFATGNAPRARSFLRRIASLFRLRRLGTLRSLLLFVLSNVFFERLASGPNGV